MTWDREKGVYYIEFDSNMKYNNASTIKEIEKQAKSLEKDVEKKSTHIGINLKKKKVIFIKNTHLMCLKKR